MFVACLAVFPGLPLAYIIRKPQSLAGWVTDSLIWSSVLVSAIAWFPPLWALPLRAWIVVCTALGIAGLTIACRLALSATRGRRWISGDWFDRALVAGIALALAGYVAMALVRANVDWDAIDYYLFAAVDIALADHFVPIFSSHVTLVSGAPDTVAPLLPVFYAFALRLSGTSYALADAAIRLVPVVFVAGIGAATYRIARNFLSPRLALVTLLVALTLPGCVGYFGATALLLDFPSAFVLVALTAEIFERGVTWRRAAVFGALVSLAVLTKVTGLAEVFFIALTWASARVLPANVARAVIALVCVAMVAAAWRLAFFAAVASPWLWAAIAATSLGAVCSAGTAQTPRLRFDLPAVAALIVASIPGGLFLARLTGATGSPIVMYVPSMMHALNANWSWALAALRGGDLYRNVFQPGLPDDFGPGLVLWWGFGPLVNLCALAGIVLAIRERTALRNVALPIFLFELAWLTVFKLDDFRHLLPVLPLLAVCAVAGIARLSRGNERLAAAAALVFAALDAPFAWTGLETIFRTPIAFLQPLAWNQWNSLSTIALRNIALYAALVLAIVLACRNWLGRAAVVLPFLAVALPFSPVLATGISPGFAAQRATVMDGEYYGYVRALRVLMGSVPGAVVLSYQNYGVTWFSLGSLRRADIADALDLGVVRAALSAPDKRAALREFARIGVRGAILPVPDSDSGRAMQRLARAGGLRRLDLFFDPQLVDTKTFGTWFVAVIRNRPATTAVR